MMCRRRTPAVFLMSAVLFLAPGSSSSAETLIITLDGREYTGDVIAAGVNTLRMKLKGSGYQIVTVQSISRIQVDVADGEPIEGKYLDWSDGEITVRVGDRDVAIRDGSITSVTDVGGAVGGPNLSPADSTSTGQPSSPQPSATPEPADAKTVPENATM